MDRRKSLIVDNARIEDCQYLDTIGHLKWNDSFADGYQQISLVYIETDKSKYSGDNSPKRSRPNLSISQSAKKDL